MASPLPTRKKSVDLAAPVPRVSRIRRDPPPPVKTVTAAEVKEREARAIVVGIVTLAVALLVLLVSVSNSAGWSPATDAAEVERQRIWQPKTPARGKRRVAK